MRRRGILSIGAAVLSLLGALSVAREARAQMPAPAPETVAVGDWQLAPLLELRTRGEVWRDPLDMGGVDLLGRSSPRVRNAYAVLERSRLGIGAERGALRVKLTLQDARAWGSPSPTALLDGATGNASFGAYEAYVEATTSAAHPSYVRLGRQAVTWGDGRLLSNADGSPTARTLDALRGSLALGAWDLELLAAILATPHPLGVAFADTAGPTGYGAQLYGARVAVAADPLLKGELMALARVARAPWSPDDGSRFAASRRDGEAYLGALRVFGDAHGWRYAVEGAYELGRTEALGDASIAAWATAAYVEKKLDMVLWGPTLRLAGEVASGDDGAERGTYTQFDPLLPDVHPLHGAMDAFAWSNAAQASARIGVVPSDDVRASIEYRYARLVDAHGEWLNAYLLAVGRGAGEAELGHEVDGSIGWRPWPALDLTAGYSLFVAGDGARAILAAQARGHADPTGAVTPSDLSHFAYLQATVTVP